MGTGVLYLVATPLGNLGDITFRAVEMLKAATLIAAEDTRRTKGLCRRYAITTPLISLREHNEGRKAPELIEHMKAGESIALVTDAGMPVVSDPGAYLVELAAAAGIPVTVIPGPSAVTTAIALSGFRGERFRFEGFPPKKSAAVELWLKKLAEQEWPVVCYESPFRLVRTLETIRAVLGEIPVVVAREMTKLHEEVTRGSTSEVLKRYTERPPKGEITLLFRPQTK